MSNCPIREINRLTKHTLQGVPTYTRSQKSAFSGLCVCYKWVWLVTKFSASFNDWPNFLYLSHCTTSSKSTFAYWIPSRSHSEVFALPWEHLSFLPTMQFKDFQLCNFSRNFMIMTELILPTEKSKIGSETHDTRDLNLLQPFNHISPKRLFGVKQIWIKNHCWKKGNILFWGKHSYWFKSFVRRWWMLMEGSWQVKHYGDGSSFPLCCVKHCDLVTFGHFDIVTLWHSVTFCDILWHCVTMCDIGKLIW